MLNNDSVIEFFKENPALELKSLEIQSEIPQGTLSKVMNGSRKLNEKHLQKLEPILRKYGFFEVKNKTIAIVNHKGGVGKTTTTLNLGKGLSMEGRKVLIVDMDPQSNLSQSLGIDEPEETIYDVLCSEKEPQMVKASENFYIIPADLDLANAEHELQKDVNGIFQLKKFIGNIRNDFDVILIDCPPSLGIYTLNAMIAADHILIVVEPEKLALKGIDSIFRLTEKVKENLNPELDIMGLLISKIDARTNVHQAIENAIRTKYPKVFKTTIRRNIALAEASLKNLDIFNYDDKTKGAEDYKNLTKEIYDVL
jgi:chromosome partitioning protein